MFDILQLSVTNHHGIFYIEVIYSDKYGEIISKELAVDDEQTLKEFLARIPYKSSKQSIENWYNDLIS